MLDASIDAGLNPVWAELDTNGGQDIAAWAAQGPIVDRTRERLGESDRGIILWRELLQRQLRVVEDGGEPMNVIRDPDRKVREIVDETAAKVGENVVVRRFVRFAVGS